MASLEPVKVSTPLDQVIKEGRKRGLAEVHGVTAYGAAYLLLARSEGLPLATLDKKMRKVAGNMGITVFGVAK